MKKLVSLFSVFLLFTLTLNAQGILDRLGNTAKKAAIRSVDKRVDKKVEEETNKA